MIRKLSELKLICVLSLILSTWTSYAQNSEELKIHFRQNRSDIDSSLFQNQKNLDRLTEILTEDQKIDSIVIKSWASPEGTLRRNIELSEERAATVRTFIIENLPTGSADNTLIRTYPMSENWVGLINEIETRYHRYNREEVLALLKDQTLKDDVRKWKLRQIDNGFTWDYLCTLYMPFLRATSVITIFRSLPKAEAQVPEEIEEEITSVLTSPTVTDTYSESTTSGHTRKVYMAFRTNMLYDAALTPTIGVDFHLGRNWTLGANWSYAWWHKDSWSYYHRVYGGDINLRKYFGASARRRPLSGHHIGVYAQALTYDFEYGSTGYLSELSYGGGLEYGYSLPVSKTLNIDFSIGCGYLGGEYKVYGPIDDHYVWRETRQRHWYGPTKAEISLVWNIGNKDFRKGGAR